MRRLRRVLLKLALDLTLPVAVSCGWEARRTRGGERLAWSAGGLALLLFFAGWFYFVLIRNWRDARRKRAELRLARGLCPACGYDCRVTPERCPECGTVP
jgi:hypothetical protein